MVIRMLGGFESYNRLCLINNWRLLKMKDVDTCKPRLYLTANTLKFIAIIAMTIDHIAYSFAVLNDLPQSFLNTFISIIGLIAAPTMFYFAVEGYHHTKNIKKYFSRLAIFAVISWFPFSYFINGGIIAGLTIHYYLFFNVIYTILLGMLAICVRRKLKNKLVKAILILSLIILSTPGNWGFWGVIFMLVFDYFYGSFKKQAFGYCVVVLLYIILATNIQTSLFVFFTKGVFDLNLLSVNFAMQRMGLFIPILLLYFYNGQRGGGGAFAKWFFYIFYPLHLLVLGFLQTVL